MIIRQYILRPQERLYPRPPSVGKEEISPMKRTISVYKFLTILLCAGDKEVNLLAVGR